MKTRTIPRHTQVHKSDCANGSGTTVQEQRVTSSAFEGEETRETLRRYQTAYYVCLLLSETCLIKLQESNFLSHFNRQIACIPYVLFLPVSSPPFECDGFPSAKQRASGGTA